MSPSFLGRGNARPDVDEVQMTDAGSRKCPGQEAELSWVTEVTNVGNLLRRTGHFPAEVLPRVIRVEVDWMG
jgi:hypothetical protein